MDKITTEEKLAFECGYRQSIRDVLDGIKKMAVEFEDPTGGTNDFYPADDVLKMLLDMALNGPKCKTASQPKKGTQRWVQYHSEFKLPESVHENAKEEPNVTN